MPGGDHAQVGDRMRAAALSRRAARLDDIAAIKLDVHVETFNKINKTGALRNAADRDPLPAVRGRVACCTAADCEDYSDEFAANPASPAARADARRRKSAVYALLR